MLTCAYVGLWNRFMTSKNGHVMVPVGSPLIWASALVNIPQCNIGPYLIISTPREHGYHRLLTAILPCKLATLQALFLLLSKMTRSLGKTSSSRKERLCFTDLSIREAALDDTLSLGLRVWRRLWGCPWGWFGHRYQCGRHKVVRRRSRSRFR